MAVVAVPPAHHVDAENRRVICGERWVSEGALHRMDKIIQIEQICHRVIDWLQRRASLG